MWLYFQEYKTGLSYCCFLSMSTLEQRINDLKYLSGQIGVQCNKEYFDWQVGRHYINVTFIFIIFIIMKNRLTFLNKVIILSIIIIISNTYIIITICHGLS